MRLLVCGDRKWSNFAEIRRRLNDWLSRRLSERDEEIVIIQGGASGADGMAKRWAEDKGSKVTCLTFDAEWSRFGKRAGPIRNQKQLEEGKPDLVYAFHDDIASSKGTADMVERARAAGIEVFLFNAKGRVVDWWAPRKKEVKSKR